MAIYFKFHMEIWSLLQERKLCLSNKRAVLMMHFTRFIEVNKKTFVFWRKKVMSGISNYGLQIPRFFCAKRNRRSRRTYVQVILYRSLSYHFSLTIISLPFCTSTAFSSYRFIAWNISIGLYFVYLLRYGIVSYYALSIHQLIVGN